MRLLRARAALRERLEARLGESLAQLQPPPQHTLVCAPMGPASEAALVWQPVIAVGSGSGVENENAIALTASPATKPAGNRNAFALIMIWRTVVRIRLF